jgi:hypothetical protein
MLLSLMHAFIAAKHSLSSSCFFSPNPAAFIHFHPVDNLLVNPDHFSLRPVLHSLSKYVIFVKVDGYHDVAVAALGFVGECTHLVGVDFFIEVLHVYEYVVEFGWREGAERWGVSFDFYPCFFHLDQFFISLLFC